ncbi:MAG: amidohydrolase family protein [Acetobacteraceae bacterium]|nr:amidohydrolase family protein [Acetobacteraceae bacterium]
MASASSLCLKGQVWTPQGPVDGGWVLVEGGVISAVGGPHDPPPGGEGAPSLGGREDLVILPGFIDLHLHGFGDHGFLGPPDLLPEALDGASKALPVSGVTCFLAGWTGLDPAEALRFVEAAAPCVKPQGQRRSGGAALTPCSEGGSGSRRFPPAPPPPAGPPRAHLAGLYLEGPWLALPGPVQGGTRDDRRPGRPAAPGGRQPWAASPLEAARLAESLLERAQSRLRVVTISPELPGPRAVIPLLARAGVVVAIGHTRASYEACREAAEAGATHVTHGFNRMSPWHHRRPGPVGAALLDPRLRVEVVPDGIHLHPAAVELAWRAKGRGGLVAVSDQVGAGTGLGVGEAPPGVPGARLWHADGGRAAWRTPTGALLAGATPANRLLQWLWTQTPIPRQESLEFLTLNPARILGLEGRKGEISPGRDADLVVLDEGFTVRLTLVGGRVAYALG